MYRLRAPIARFIRPSINETFEITNNTKRTYFRELMDDLVTVFKKDIVKMETTNFVIESSCGYSTYYFYPPFSNE